MEEPKKFAIHEAARDGKSMNIISLPRLHEVHFLKQKANPCSTLDLVVESLLAVSHII
jgi:hypothetical protein